MRALIAANLALLCYATSAQSQSCDYGQMLELQRVTFALQQALFSEEDPDEKCEIAKELYTTQTQIVQLTEVCDRAQAIGAKSLARQYYQNVRRYCSGR
jgi:hypothetical protein